VPTRGGTARAWASGVATSCFGGLIASRCKTAAPSGAGGLFSNDRFDIDPGAQTATYPPGSAPRSAHRNGDSSGIAYIGPARAGCGLRARWAHSKAGRIAGRRARVRGTPRVDADFSVLAGVVNLGPPRQVSDSSTLTAGTWTVATA
jgi:hypothetical protein